MDPEIAWNQDYRLSYARYAMNVRRSSPGTARRCWQHLRGTPCLVGRDPHPETGLNTRLRKVVPWWKLMRWKNCGKGKVKYDG